MEQKDYILREISKLGAMLRMFIRRRFEQKDTREEEEETEQLAVEFAEETGMELKSLIRLGKADFDSFFALNRGFNNENIELLADFVVELAKSSTSQNPKELFQKAIEFYSYIDEKGKTYSMERAAKIQQLKGLLKY